MVEYWLIAWLGNPPLVIFPLVGLAFLPWILRTKQRRPPVNRTALILLATYLLLISPPIVQAGTWLLHSWLPGDRGQPVDAIVILGRGSQFQAHRVETAVQLWRSQRATQIFASGIYDAPRLVKRLRQQGIPPAQLDGESCSRTTPENAWYTRAALRTPGKPTILLVTDPPHLPRSFLIFEQAGFQTIPALSPLPGDYPSAENALLLIREYWLMAHYWLDRSFHPLTPEDIQAKVVVAANQMGVEQCRPGGRVFTAEP